MIVDTILLKDSKNDIEFRDSFLTFRTRQSNKAQTIFFTSLGRTSEHDPAVSYSSKYKNVDSKKFCCANVSFLSIRPKIKEIIAASSSTKIFLG